MNEKKLPVSDAKMEEIARTFGTPFHLYDEKGIVDGVKRLEAAFSWCRHFREYFAVKATPNPWIMKLLKDLGVGADCSSMAELVLSDAVGLSGTDIVFSSNDTPYCEYKEAMRLGAIVNLDDISHIPFIEARGPLPEKICFRYNPGPDLGNRGNGIIGKPEEAKYGMTRQQLLDAVKWARDQKISYIGIHTMVISCELSMTGLLGTVSMMFDLAREIKEKLGVTVSFIDFGGGIGLAYRPEETPVDFAELGRGVKALYDEKMGDFPDTQLSFECGRIVTGPYGFLVTRAIHYKHIYRNYIGTDACMADLMRPGMYGAYHHITVVGKENVPATEVYDVTGSLCENNDKFAVQRKLPPIDVGDLLVIHDTGAHGHSMGFNYNGKLRHQELLLHEDGTVTQIRRNETLSDLFATLDFPGLAEKTKEAEEAEKK